jgi:hypothetical protein
MKTSLSTSKIALTGLCLIAIIWLAATVLFEVHLGWPVNTIQWAKRLLGWAVEFWLVRTVFLAARRYGPGMFEKRESMR